MLKTEFLLADQKLSIKRSRTLKEPLKELSTISFLCETGQLQHQYQCPFIGYIWEYPMFIERHSSEFVC